MILIEHLLFGAALLLLVSIFASKIAARTGIPALLLFLALGMLAGSDGILGIYFDYPALAQAIGVVALIFILFSGGLDTQWRDIRPVLRQGITLATVGVSITAIAVGWFATTFFGFSWAEGILLGAIISSTDAAAVFAVLRGSRLKGQLIPLLELESGSNDPMAVFLTIGMIQLIQQPDLAPTALIPLFIVQMGIGAGMGILIGLTMRRAINHARLEYDGLYPVLTIATVLLSYGLTTLLGGNGFLAVYLVGILFSQVNLIHKRSLSDFHDGLAWLMQIAMFLALGLQVYPSQLPAIAGQGLAIALFVIVIARPVSVTIALLFSRFTWRERVFVSWVGLRGAAPIILATFPLLAGIEQATVFFNLVFFIVLASVLVQGTLIIPVAKGLGVYGEQQPKSLSPLAFVMDDGIITNNLIEFTVPEASPVCGKQIADLQLPDGTLIVLIGRKDDLVVPRGGTLLEAGDRVLLLTRDANLPSVKALMQI
jgi:cell volume regulation protein A